MMTDPFEALRDSVAPVDPDPRFAARLRARLERALLAPEGVTMTTTTPAADTTTTAAADLPLHNLTPYITVDDARGALDWYVRALGARRRGEPIVMDDDRVGHAELAFGDSVLMFADEFPEIRLRGPKARGGVSHSMRLEVADVDGTVERAVELGAELERPVADHPYGRNGVIIDPFGHRWMVAAPVPAETEPETTRLYHGDVVYSSLWVPDVERAAAFYSSVLGWRYGPGTEPRGRQVEGLGQRIGLWGDEEHNTMFLCFAVDDVAAAVERVRAAGGQAGEPTQEPYGLIADCADDQGMRFAVYELPPEESVGVAAGRYGHGEICYLTIEVPDSARARAFFGAVLGWEFTPGRAEDGWSARNAGREVHYMTGMHGGHDQSTVVPMFFVDDIEPAVERVRAAGGTATEPDRQPYGVTAECADDQGTHFYLGELS
jgi:predicted enzyme related to lactoylglutathione lyase